MPDTLRERVNELICDVSEGWREVGEVRDAILAWVAEERAASVTEQNDWYGKRCQWYQGEIAKAEARVDELDKECTDRQLRIYALQAREAALVDALRHVKAHAHMAPETERIVVEALAGVKEGKK